MEVKLKLSIPNFHATVGQPKLAHFYSQAFTAIDPSMEPSKSLLGHICQKCKTVFSKEHILELHTRLYCFPDDQQGEYWVQGTLCTRYTVYMVSIVDNKLYPSPFHALKRHFCLDRQALRAAYISLFLD